ncbi:hypothetical protein B0H17DRAFT_1138656 [Mycena rosella]|uniref:Uncharacterized protein n=1 Tax=Mycena rosella TaxID=1033263 RepID=A0AAD7GC41_MYCRO|nr:hypothetical protein B0H17DRAFT_1138656 [Mycena rosella]
MDWRVFMTVIILRGIAGAGTRRSGKRRAERDPSGDQNPNGTGRSRRAGANRQRGSSGVYCRDRGSPTRLARWTVAGTNSVVMKGEDGIITCTNLPPSSGHYPLYYIEADNKNVDPPRDISREIWYGLVVEIENDVRYVQHPKRCGTHENAKEVGPVQEPDIRKLDTLLMGPA